VQVNPSRPFSLVRIGYVGKSILAFANCTLVQPKGFPLGDKRQFPPKKTSAAGSRSTRFQNPGRVF
jgi:hypothetical protein